MVMEKDTTLGEKIRTLRLGRETPLRKLAIDVGVSAGYISDIENGNRHPSPETLDKIARILKTDPEELKACDEHIDLETRRWTQKHPLVGVMLRRLRQEEDPDRLAKEMLEMIKKERAR